MGTQSSLHVAERNLGEICGLGRTKNRCSVALRQHCFRLNRGYRPRECRQHPTAQIRHRLAFGHQVQVDIRRDAKGQQRLVEQAAVLRGGDYVATRPARTAELLDDRGHLDGLRPSPDDASQVYQPVARRRMACHGSDLTPDRIASSADAATLDHAMSAGGDSTRFSASWNRIDRAIPETSPGGHMPAPSAEACSGKLEVKLPVLVVTIGRWHIRYSAILHDAPMSMTGDSRYGTARRSHELIYKGMRSCGTMPLKMTQSCSIGIAGSAFPQMRRARSSPSPRRISTADSKSPTPRSGSMLPKYPIRTC